MVWSEASSPLYEDVQLGKPALRIWDLNEDSTIYDRQRAAPSDETLHRVWIAWSSFFSVFAAFNIIVFLGIVTARKVRRRPFNVYVIFLMIPDILYTFSCAIQCALLAIHGGFRTPASCQIQSFYLMFGLTANSYMNALVARELKQLLTWSSRRARYTPPTPRKITQDCMVVYFFSAALSAASWVVRISWWPHRTDLQSGLVCLPIAFDLASSLVFWCFFFPIMSGVPLIYCIYVAWFVKKNDLLPPVGKRRELMIYFYRITGVFAIMWVPGVFFFYVSVLFPKVSIWAIYIASVWSHAQGAVSAAVSMMKEDVYKSVINLVCCQGNWDDPFLTPRRPTQVSSFGFRSSMIEGSSGANATETSRASAIFDSQDIDGINKSSADFSQDFELDDDFSQGSTHSHEEGMDEEAGENYDEGPKLTGAWAIAMSARQGDEADDDADREGLGEARASPDRRKRRTSLFEFASRLAGNQGKKQMSDNPGDDADDGEGLGQAPAARTSRAQRNRRTSLIELATRRGDNHGRKSRRASHAL